LFLFSIKIQTLLINHNLLSFNLYQQISSSILFPSFSKLSLIAHLTTKQLTLRHALMLLHAFLAEKEQHRD